MTARLTVRLTPSLLDRDLDETLKYYERLGFRVTGKSRNDRPTWAEVRRDDVLIQLFIDPPQGLPDTPCFRGTLYIHPESVAALAAEWNGVVAFAWGPELMPYGMREFGIQDPNGYF